MPKISVIIPVYNTSIYLKKCLESVLNQTYQPFEIIIVNDGSTDNSEEIILDFKNKYQDRIRYFKNSHNGIAVTRNYGVEKVLGDYFIFVDSDDFIEKDVLEKLNDVILDKIDIIKYKMKILNKNGYTMINGPVFNIEKGEDAFNQLCFKDKMIDTPCLYMFNTKFFKNNHFIFLPNTYHEDFGLIPLIILKANKIISINYYGYNYVQKENSITRNEDYEKTLKRANDLLLHYDKMIEDTKNMKLNRKTQKNVKQYYTMAILSFYKKIKNEEKEKYKKEIKKRKLLKNIRIRSLKSFLKKLLLIIGMNTY